MTSRSGPVADLDARSADALSVAHIERGLSSAEAESRLRRDGPNELPRARRVPLWSLIAGQLRDPLILVLLVAAVLTLATGDWTDASVILFVIVVNTTVGVVQEVKAEREIAALSELAAPDARVLRDGEQRQIPAAAVVVEDVLVLAEGDIVPADARLVEAVALLVDESALTGESVPWTRHQRRSWRRRRRVRGDRGHPRSRPGRGDGDRVGQRHGADCRAGRRAPRSHPAAATASRHRRVLAAAAVALCAIVLAIGLVKGQPVELMVITAISLVVAAVPESLPAVVTLALALGARRMSARNALIRRLPAVETLGSVTVLATDKTGTLTEGNMVARRLWTSVGRRRGQRLRLWPGRRRDQARRARSTRKDAPDLASLLTAGALCNDAALLQPSGDREEWTAVGDPTEAATACGGRQARARCRRPERAVSPRRRGAF